MKETQPIFLTDTRKTLPTLEKIHPDQAKNMQHLCKEMEGLIDQTNTNVNQMLKTQQNSILCSFKSVLETMKKDIDKINEKFNQYVAFHEQESQVVNAQNKMVFFREECHVLNEQCKSLKLNIQQLTKANQFLENELQFVKEALFKQVQKNQKMQTLLEKYKEKLNSAFEELSKQQQQSQIQLYQVQSHDSKLLFESNVNQDQIIISEKRDRPVSKQRRNVQKHNQSFNSVTASEKKSKNVLSQQTRAQSLQKSFGQKRSSVFEQNILDRSVQLNQIYEYSKYQSIKDGQ